MIPKKDSNTNLSLMESPKISTLLAPLTLAPTHIGPTYEWSHGRIQHLKTDIESSMNKPFNFKDLCKLLHPTPALGLFSQTVHWKWLKQIEPKVPRKKFGAPFGALLPDGRAMVVVAIRNIQWSGGQSYLGSGCGIVEPSELNQEWAELSIKRRSVIESLGMKNHK